MNTSYDIDKISILLDKEKWHWGNTHEYITKADCLMSPEDFQMIIDATINLGDIEKKYRHSYHCLKIGNHKYWTHIVHIDSTILNREITLPEIESQKNVYIPDDVIPFGYVSSLRSMFGDYWHDREVFEIFCGWGWSIEPLKLDIKKYTGIDNNPRNITLFKNIYPYAYNHIYSALFEESYGLWSKGDSIILGTFGAASYVSTTGLRDLGKSGKDYLLMFYQERYFPKGYERICYNKYSLEDIQLILPNAQILPLYGFYVVSNMELHKHEVNRIVEYELSHLGILFNESCADKNIPYNDLFHHQMKHIMREGDNLFQRYSTYIEYSKIGIDCYTIIKQYEYYICKYNTIKSKISDWDRDTFEYIMISVCDRITLFSECQKEYL